jgi:hypothetical protein
MVQLTAVAIVVLLAAYLLGPKTNSLTGAYEIAGVLPLSAVLAGRMLADRLPGSRLGPILAVVLVCYAGLLVGHAGHRHAFSENQRVAIWLRAHHLSYGLAWYWHANVVTADSGNQVQVRPVAARGYTLVLNHIQSQASWYDPRLHYANFVIAPGKLSACVPRARRWCPWAAAFGQPVRAYQVGNLVVMVWDKNLLDTHFEQGPPIPPPSIAAGRGDGRVPGIVG